jgi:hypothetical protein
VLVAVSVCLAVDVLYRLIVLRSTVVPCRYS